MTKKWGAAAVVFALLVTSVAYLSYRNWGQFNLPLREEDVLFPEGQDEAVTFAVIGDYGLAGPGETAVANLVKSWNPDFIITTGDNNYPDGAAQTIEQNIGDYYGDYIAADRFFPSLGNHDLRTENGQPYLDYFPISESTANTQSSGNERYYDFIVGPVHLFALNSHRTEPDGNTSGSEQAAWLEEQLANSPAPWQIVFFHHPPYSSGRHGSQVWMQWPFAQWGADAVLAGHDHNYERLEVDGIPYFVNGAGGKSIRRMPFFAVPNSQVRYNGDYGAMRVYADPEKIIFAFYAVSSPDFYLDHYTIER